MSKVYLIAGLGADTRVYNNIDLSDHEVTCVDWIIPHQTDTLATYAQKLIFQYHITPNSVVIGNSLGGMIAIEMAKFIPLQKVIQISSIKTVDEAPWYFPLFRWFPVYKIIPGSWYKHLSFFVKFIFGKMSADDAWLFMDMLKKSSPIFLKWAMGAALDWDNKIVPENVFQITGDKDLVFSYKRIKGATIIKGGTHIIIFDKAKQINKLLKEILKK